MEKPLTPDDIDSEESPQTPAPARGWERLFRVVPALGSLRTYTWRSLRADTLAGITVATVAVPQAMAYALIAGLPPQYGLYTAIVMTAVGALLDSSRQLINGPVNAIAIALFSALAFVPADQRVAAATVLALMVGTIQTGITLLRLGDLTRFISHGVIVGFTVGASVLLILGQFQNLVGLQRRGIPGDHFLKRFWLTLWEGEVHGWTAVIGLSTIILVLLLRQVRDWVGRRLRVALPEFLLAVIAMSALVWAADLHNNGVKVVGTIPPALPGFELPVVEWSRVERLAGSALAIAVLGLLEAIAMAKAIAAQTGQKLDINQQCLSEGVANLAGGFFQCFPGSGSLTRSAINQAAGAVSQWSGIISAVAVAVTILLFAPLAYYIPRAALAGILMVTAVRMVDRQQLIYHLRATRFDAGIVIATALSAVVVSVEFCILIGVFLSFVLYVPRAARLLLTEFTVTPERVVRERAENDPPCGRILIYNLEGEMFFGAGPDLEKHFATISARAKSGVGVIVLRLKRARNFDAVCLGLLERFLRTMHARKITVLLCGVRPELAKMLYSSGLEKLLGRGNIFLEGTASMSSTLDAVRHAYGLLGGDVCEGCPRRDMIPNGQEQWYYMI